MEHTRFLTASLWLIWAVVSKIADTKKGEKVSHASNVALICATVWMASV